MRFVLPFLLVLVFAGNAQAWTPDPSRPPANVVAALEKQGAKYGVRWEVLASILWMEQRIPPGKWEDTIASCGSDRSWANAQGCFQFIPSTWADYSCGGSVSEFVPSACAAARLLRSNYANEITDGGPRSIAYLRYASAVYNSGCGYDHDNGTPKCGGAETREYVVGVEKEFRYLVGGTKRVSKKAAPVTRGSVFDPGATLTSGYINESESNSKKYLLIAGGTIVAAFVVKARLTKMFRRPV